MFGLVQEKMKPYNSVDFLKFLIKKNAILIVFSLLFISAFSQVAEFYWLLIANEAFANAQLGSPYLSQLILAIIFLFFSIYGPNLFMRLDAFFQSQNFNTTFSYLTRDAHLCSSKLLSNYPGIKVVSDIRQAAQAARVILNFLSFDLIRTIIAILFSTAFCFSLNRGLALFVFSWCGIFLLISFRSVKKNSASSFAFSESMTNTNRVVANSLSNNKLFSISRFGKEELNYLLDVIKLESDGLYKLKNLLARSGFYIISQRFLLTLVTIFYGVFSLIKSEITIPELLILIQYNNLLILNISGFSVRILEVGNEFNVLKTALNNLFRENEIESYNRSTVKFDTLVLNQFFEKIDKPGCYLLKGPSGIGKTTLIEQLYMTLRSRYKNDQIVYVPRDSLILDRSIDGNLFSKKDAKETESLLFPMLPSLTSRLNEDASVLSSGEKQRINLIRLIKGNPKYIILDEATSSLDENSATEFYRRLLLMFSDSVILVVSHRSSEISLFQNVFVMRGQGLPIEREELIKKERI